MSNAPGNSDPAAALARTSSERRRHPRYQSSQELAPVVLGSGNLGLIVDLAEGGMKIRSVSALQPGSTTFLQFEAAQSTIEATAKVIWTDARRYAGVQFISLSESATRSIRQSLTMSVTQERAWPLESSSPTSAVNISSTLGSSSELKPQRAPLTE